MDLFLRNVPSRSPPFRDDSLEVIDSNVWVVHPDHMILVG